MESKIQVSFYICNRQSNKIITKFWYTTSMATFYPFLLCTWQLSAIDRLPSTRRICYITLTVISNHTYIWKMRGENKNKLARIFWINNEGIGECIGVGWAALWLATMYIRIWDRSVDCVVKVGLQRSPFIYKHQLLFFNHQENVVNIYPTVGGIFKILSSCLISTRTRNRKTNIIV